VINQAAIANEALSRRSKGWKIQYVLQVPIPNDVSYADGEAFAVCVMKQYNELGEDPQWLRGCDEETHQLYYAGHPELARTQSTIETDLVIYAEGRFIVLRCKPASPEQLVGQPFNIAFDVEFPATLPVQGETS
jgi:hypothetical protein